MTSRRIGKRLTTFRKNRRRSEVDMALISADMQSDLVINKMNANVFEQLKIEKRIVPD